MRKHEHITTRIIPIILIVLTSSIAILTVAIKDRRSTGSLYTLTTANRDTVGLLIQVFAAALGACQVYAITSVINLSARLRLQTGHSSDFRRLKFLTAITSGSSQAIRTVLPATWLTTVIVIVVILKVPAALWAGALTPITADVVINEGRIPVPTYDSTTNLWAWQSSFKKSSNGTVDMSVGCRWNVSNDKIIPGAAGIVSTCPALDLVSAILGSLATAAAGTLSAPKPHSRVDNSGWINTGRSFGVGSSAGLMAVQGLSDREAPMLSFDYFEYGYLTDVNCLRNTSSTYALSTTPVLNSEGVYSYEVSGTLPNSPPGSFEQYVLSSSTNDTSFLAWSALANNGQNMLAVAGSGYYAAFDKIECSVNFQPSRFSVHVNVTNNLIVVKSAPDGQPVTDIEPTGVFTTSVLYALEQISRMSGNTIISSLGTPLEHNTRFITQRNSTLNSNDSALLSVEYGAGTLLDNLFVANGQSQMFLLENSTTAPLAVRYHAVKLGSDKYIYGVLVTNLLMLLLITAEALRTRWWKGVTEFDFTDIQDIGRAASAGGTAIASSCLARQELDNQSDRVPLGLRIRDGHWVLVPTHELNSMEDTKDWSDSEHMAGHIEMQHQRFESQSSITSFLKPNNHTYDDDVGLLIR